VAAYLAERAREKDSRFGVQRLEGVLIGFETPATCWLTHFAGVVLGKRCLVPATFASAALRFTRPEQSELGHS